MKNWDFEVMRIMRWNLLVLEEFKIVGIEEVRFSLKIELKLSTRNFIDKFCLKKFLKSSKFVKKS